MLMIFFRWQIPATVITSQLTTLPASFSHLRGLPACMNLLRGLPACMSLLKELPACMNLLKELSACMNLLRELPAYMSLLERLPFIMNLQFPNLLLEAPDPHLQVSLPLVKNCFLTSCVCLLVAD